MAHKIKGDLAVSRQIDSKRSNESLTVDAALAADYAVDAYDNAWKSFTAAADQNIELPDATLLPIGWKVVIHNMSASADLSVLSYDGTFTGALQKKINAPEAPNDTLAYQFTLIDNGTAAGVWYVIELGDSQNVVAARYVVNFLVADWPAAVAGKKTLTSTQKAGLAAATHGRGVSPMLVIQEKIGTDHDRLTLDRERTSSAGDVSLTIITNDEFDGRVILI